MNMVITVEGTYVSHEIENPPYVPRIGETVYVPIQNVSNCVKAVVTDVIYDFISRGIFVRTRSTEV